MILLSKQSREIIMAMTKKEQIAYEAALTSAALRHTASVPTDLEASQEVPFITGYHVCMGSVFSYSVKEACSSTVGHSLGSKEKTTSQRAIPLHSTEELALRELRFRMEQEFAKHLRKVDLMIEQAQAKLAE